jgi:WbqC-like protein family
MPFPSIVWWAHILDADLVALDTTEPFQKMSLLNRYRISGADTSINLTVPVAGGRDQHNPLHSLRIFNQHQWQKQHWRTLVSVYNRSPYFTYYAPYLEELYTTSFERLEDFNLCTVRWIARQMKVPADDKLTTDISLFPANAADIRSLKKRRDTGEGAFPHYYQVFEERTGFLTNLSILDLLFSEGPDTRQWLEVNSHLLKPMAQLF